MELTLGDRRLRNSERDALLGDPEAKRRMERERERRHQAMAGYQEFVGKRIILLGARWHYEGTLEKSSGDYLILRNARMIFNYTLEQGVSASDPLGTVHCNHTHVASVSLSPFKDDIPTSPFEIKAEQPEEAA